MVAVRERLPFCDAKFDCIFSINVLEHVADLGAVLSESARVLIDGGLWLAITPNGNWEPLLNLAEPLIVEDSGGTTLVLDHPHAPRKRQPRV